MSIIMDFCLLFGGVCLSQTLVQDLTLISNEDRMLSTSSDRSNMKQCMSMDILLNLECNQVCRGNSLDSTP